MKKVLHIALVALLAAGFSSCGSGGSGGSGGGWPFPGGGGGTSSSIVGTWNFTWSSGWIKDSSGQILDEWNESASGTTFVLNADGTGTVSAEVRMSVTWTLANQTLTLIGDGETSSYPVKKLTATELVITMAGSGEIDGIFVSYSEDMTFTKR